jgi:hypothetical protein
VKIRPYTVLFKDSTAGISASSVRSGYGPYRSTWVVLFIHKSCALSKFSLCVGKLIKESQNSVLILQNFSFRDKWFQLFIKFMEFFEEQHLCMKFS